MKEPYNEHDLLRTDAVGGRTKRNAAAFWSKQLRNAERNLLWWRSQVEEYADSEESRHRIAHKHAKMKVEEWSGKKQAAESRLEEIKKLIMHAWD